MGRARRVVGAACGLCLLLPVVVKGEFRPGYQPKDETLFMYAFRYASPEKAAASLTVMRARERDYGLRFGWYAQVEAGTAGGKAGIGWGVVEAPLERHWLPRWFGAGIKGSVLRTWRTPKGVDPQRTLLGPELDLTLGVKLTFGCLWDVSGGASDKGPHFTWGVGMGF
jgi:hypothetical protein